MSKHYSVAVFALLLSLQACGGDDRGQIDDDVTDDDHVTDQDTDEDIVSDTDVLGDTDNLPAVTITQQPANKTVVEGAPASFSVVATNATGYQWQRSSDGVAPFVDVSSATLAEYTTPATSLADNGARYRVVVTGAANSVASQAA
ncbi:MAG: hypothetical protein ACAI38_13605, partial [Myxococcota bacterium]